MKLKHILILQNKIDLVKETAAAEQYKQIVTFLRGTIAEGAPIIPISAQLRYNIEVLLEYMVLSLLGICSKEDLLLSFVFLQ